MQKRACAPSPAALPKVRSHFSQTRDTSSSFLPRLPPPPPPPPPGRLRPARPEPPPFFASWGAFRQHEHFVERARAFEELTCGAFRGRGAALGCFLPAEWIEPFVPLALFLPSIITASTSGLLLLLPSHGARRLVRA